MISSAVAIGGGHGTSVTLRALRQVAEEVCGVVSVADDGGSSGRLRELLGVVAYGDIRKCLVALSPDGPAARAFSRRFLTGELEGHVLGNLMLAGLVEESGDLVDGVEAAGAMLGAAGRVYPASLVPVTLVAQGPDGEVQGQVAVSAAGPVRSITVEPGHVAAPSAALDALASAELIAIGPGSLFTSVLAALAVPSVGEAVAASKGKVVFVANLRPQLPETEGFSLEDQVGSLEAHGVSPDVVLADLGLSGQAGRYEDRTTYAALTATNPFVHDPAALALALEQVADGSSSRRQA